MIVKNKKLFFFSLVLTCFLIVSGFQLNTNLTTKSSDNILECEENELNNIKIAATEEWIKFFSTDSEDYGMEVATDSNRNVYVAGSLTLPGLYNSTLIKYSPSGVQLWNLTSQLPFNLHYRSIFIDSSNHIYIAGDVWNVTSYDTLLVKYDTDGNEIWNRTWGGNDFDTADDVAVNSQGDIYIAGGATIGGNRELVLIKYNSTGHKQWNETCGFAGIESATCLCIDSLGNIYACGWTDSVGNYDFFITYWNSSGYLKWNETWGCSEDDWINDITIDSQDFIYIAGYSYMKGATDCDFCLVKYANTGIPVWDHIWGSYLYDNLESVSIDSRDNIYVIGETRTELREIYISKFNSDGDQLWEKSWGSHLYGYHYCSIFIDKSTDDLYLTGQAEYSVDPIKDIFVVKNPSFPTDSNIIYNYIYNIEDDDCDDDDDDNFLLIVGIASATSAIGVVAVISAILINKRLKLKH